MVLLVVIDLSNILSVIHSILLSDGQEAIVELPSKSFVLRLIKLFESLLRQRLNEVKPVSDSTMPYMAIYDCVEDREVIEFNSSS